MCICKFHFFYNSTIPLKILKLFLFVTILFASLVICSPKFLESHNEKFQKFHLKKIKISNDTKNFNDLQSSSSNHRIINEIPNSIQISNFLNEQNFDTSENKFKPPNEKEFIVEPSFLPIPLKNISIINKQNNNNKHNLTWLPLANEESSSIKLADLNNAFNGAAWTTNDRIQDDFDQIDTSQFPAKLASSSFSSAGWAPIIKSNSDQVLHSSERQKSTKLRLARENFLPHQLEELLSSIALNRGKLFKTEVGGNKLVQLADLLPRSPRRSQEDLQASAQMAHFELSQPNQILSQRLLEMLASSGQLQAAPLEWAQKANRAPVKIRNVLPTSEPSGDLAELAGTADQQDQLLDNLLRQTQELAGGQSGHAQAHSPAVDQPKVALSASEEALVALLETMFKNALTNSPSSIGSQSTQSSLSSQGSQVSTSSALRLAPVSPVLPLVSPSQPSLSANETRANQTPLASIPMEELQLPSPQAPLLPEEPLARRKRKPKKGRGGPQVRVQKRPRLPAGAHNFHEINSQKDLQSSGTLHKWKYPWLYRPYEDDDEEEGETEVNIRFFNNFSRMGPFGSIARSAGPATLILSLVFLILSNVSLAATMIVHSLTAFLRNISQNHSTHSTQPVKAIGARFSRVLQYPHFKLATITNPQQHLNTSIKTNETSLDQQIKSLGKLWS